MWELYSIAVIQNRYSGWGGKMFLLLISGQSPHTWLHLSRREGRKVDPGTPHLEKPQPSASYRGSFHCGADTNTELGISNSLSVSTEETRKLMDILKICALIYKLKRYLIKEQNAYCSLEKKLSKFVMRTVTFMLSFIKMRAHENIKSIFFSLK